MKPEVLEEILDTVDLDETVYRLTKEDVLNVIQDMPESDDMTAETVQIILQAFDGLRFDIYDWSETVQVYIEDLIEHNSNQT